MSATDRTRQRIDQLTAALSEAQLALDEERLRRIEVESTYEALIRDMSDALVLTDPAGRILKVNDAACQLFSLSDEKLVGRMLLEFAGDRFPSRISEILVLAPQGQVSSHDAEIRADGGVRIPVNFSASVVRDDSGKIIRAEYTLRDLSETQRLARVLQSNLVPPLRTEVPGFKLAFHYEASSEILSMGGDFYDLFPSGRNTWDLIIGDVCGRGVDAAEFSFLAKYTLRTAALRAGRPSRVLAILNDVILHQRGTETFCTVCYVRVRHRSDGARVTVSSGGHSLPLVLRARGGVEVIGRYGCLLGQFEDPELHDATTVLSPGDQLLLYTDGVIEAPGEDGLFGEDRLAAVCERGAGRSPQEVKEALLRELAAFQAGKARHDDQAFVLLQVASPLLLDVRLPPTPDAPALARQAIRDLPLHLPTETLQDVVLMASEAVGNSVRHAAMREHDEINLVVRRLPGRLRVEISDRGGGFQWTPYEPATDGASGRGLFIVDRISRRWGIDRDPTTVWFEVDEPGSQGHLRPAPRSAEFAGRRVFQEDAIEV